MTEDSREQFAAEARSAAPDLALLCLLMGFEADLDADAAGGIDACLAPARRALDRLSTLTAAALRATDCSSPIEVAALLAGVLAGSADLRGAPGAYDRLESSLLHHVLRRGRGLPITVSVVWITVGRMLGLPVYGVALPGHFVVGVGDPDGEHVLVDPFHGGRMLRYEAVETIATDGGIADVGHPLDFELLRPAEPLDIVLRVLGNIRAWAADRPEQARTQLWAAELALLLPRHPAQLRLERAELLVKTGRFIEGAKEMDSFAEILDAFDEDSAARVRLAARAARHRLN